MKNIKFLVAVVLVLGLAACNSNKSKLPELTNANDSINYAFGLANGNGIKNYYLAKDTANADSMKVKIASLLKGVREGMKGEVSDYPELDEIGRNIGSALKEQKVAGLMGDSTLEVDMKLIRQGLINGLRGSQVTMTAEEAQLYVNNTMQNLQKIKVEKQYGEYKKQNEAFLAANKSKTGVITTESGLQYEVLAKGTGALPTDTSRVKVHYHGTLIDGTVFDSSVDRKEPAVFGVNQVIKGWTEALKLMPVGSKYKLYIPQELAYGEANQGTIKPYSTLVFEVELLSIEK